MKIDARIPERFSFGLQPGYLNSNLNVKSEFECEIQLHLLEIASHTRTVLLSPKGAVVHVIQLHLSEIASHKCSVSLSPKGAVVSLGHCV